MLKIIGYELYKVITKRGLLLLFLLILNLVLQFISLDVNDLYKPDKDVYKSFFETINTMSVDGKYSYVSDRYTLLQKLFMFQTDPEAHLTEQEQAMLKSEGYLHYTDSLAREYFTFRYFYEDINSVISYDEYLDNIQERGNTLAQISIFSDTNSFSNKNILKTMEDYAHLKGTVLPYDTSMGIKTVTQFVPSDIITVVMIIVVCFVLVSFEKDSRLFELVKTMPGGRTTLVTSKLFSLFIICITFILLIFGSNLAVGHLSFGLGDLTRPLQSVTGFMSSPFKISVGSYLTLFILMKIAIVMTAAVIIFLTTIILHNSFYVYSAIAGLFGVSTMMYLVIDPTSSFSPLKYINLIPFIQTDMLFYEYININFFSNPVSIIPCFILFTAILLIFSIFAIIYIFINQKRPSSAKSTFTLKSGSTVNLYIHEAWKMLFAYRTIFLILLIAAGNIWWLGQHRDYPDMDEMHYRAYMEEFSGEYSIDKEQKIIDERGKFNGLMMNLANLNMKEQRYLLKQKAFDRVEQRSLYLKALAEKNTDGIPWFVYDKGYNILTAEADNKEDLKLALVYGILLIVSLSSIMSIEYQSKAVYIIRICSNGRWKLLNIKLLVSIIAAFVLYFVVYVPQYVNVNKFYGFDNLSAPITSLPQFESFSDRMTILHYLLMLNLTRLVGAVAAVLIIFILSKRSMINTMLQASVVLLMPIALSLVNLKLCEFIPTVALLSGNIALRNYPAVYAICAVLLIAILYIVLISREVRIKVRNVFHQNSKQSKKTYENT